MKKPKPKGEITHWWKSFFNPLMEEILFDPYAALAAPEISAVLKKLGLTRSSPLKILDLACGVGRHSVALAKKGHDVTGLDYSRFYIQSACSKAPKKLKNSLRFVRGSMNELTQIFKSQRFDLVLSLNNSFGYFDSRRADLKVISEASAILKLGGFFVINTLNLGGVLKKIKAPVTFSREPKKNLHLIDHARFDLKRRQVKAYWTIVDTRNQKPIVTHSGFKQNVYSHQEMKKELARNNFKVVKVWGSLRETAAFSAGSSWHQTLAARRDS